MAATVEEQKTQEAPVFDPKAFIESRNSGKEPPRPEAKPEAKAETAKPAEPEEPHARLPRSVRRELNRLREELGAANERARLALEGKATPVKEAPKEEAEPQRKDFASDAEFLRATQKWDKAQEAKEAAKAGTQAEQSEALKAHLQAMDEKAAEDMKTLPDWDEVAKRAQDDDDAPEFVPDEHPVLMGMIAGSDVKAFVLYHFAKNPADLEKMLELKSDPNALIRSFHRLEGKLEKEYSNPKAAQASSEKKEDRTNPAEAEKPGGTAGKRDLPKPKPSSEVAARGGAPAPDEPPIGSAAWMAKRNQAAYGR